MIYVVKFIFIFNENNNVPDYECLSSDGSCIEIDMKYISFDEKGNMVLPTYDDMASDALKNSAFGLDGLDDLFAILSQKGVDMKNVYILPLKSNPTIADSDYDGIVDENDENPKKENTIEIDDKILDDSK